jgi:hypothetical protein
MNKIEFTFTEDFVVIEKDGNYLSDPWFMIWVDSVCKAKKFNKEYIKSPKDVIPIKQSRGTIHNNVNYEEIIGSKLINVSLKKTYEIIK